MGRQLWYDRAAAPNVTGEKQMATETCAGCKFSQMEKAGLECRRYPPTWQLLPLPGKIAGTINIQQKNMAPTVHADHWCGEWKPKIDAP